MEERKKLSIEEFNRIKQEYIQWLESVSSWTQETYQTAANFQKNLLSYDLSMVPASAWEGLPVVCGTLEEGISFPANFEGTHANIDFHSLEIAHNIENKHWITECNFNGCNVTGLDELDLYDYYPLSNDEIKKVFGNDIIAKNPHRFPSDDIPKDVQNRFYQETLTFEDIEAYPSLLNVQLVNKPKNRSSLDGQNTAVYSWNPTLLRSILSQEPKQVSVYQSQYL